MLISNTKKRENIFKPELLLPAGNMEKLKVAFDYGADAVYLAGKELGLRGKADNFTLREIEEAVEYARKLGKKVYVATNIFANNEDLEVAKEYFSNLAAIPVDAFIISDAGLIYLAKQYAPKIPVHISTQASVTNYAACQFYKENGAERVVLGRETSMDEIKEIVEKSGVEIEVFVHGAMCMAYSGRCMLSMYMTGKSANKGLCTHPCRWKYHVVEERRPGDYLPVEEDERGTYIFNSRDLCILPHLDKLLAAGVSSLKIEGRMKSVHYVATVAKVYREAIDCWYADPENFSVKEKWVEELNKVSDRGYTLGFYFGPPTELDHNYEEYVIAQNYRFAGRVLEYLPEDKLILVEQRNRFFKGDLLEILTPKGENKEMVVEQMLDEEMNEIDVCPHPQQKIYLKVTGEIEKGSLLRQIGEDEV